MKIFLFLEVTIVHISSLKGQFARYNLRKVRQTRQPNAKGYFKTKTQARKALWVTLAL